jgi:hypothetical protein
MDAVQYIAFRDELEKIAVDLKQLRKATDLLKKRGPLVRGRRMDMSTGMLVRPRVTGPRRWSPVDKDITSAFAMPRRISPKQQESLHQTLQVSGADAVEAGKLVRKAVKAREGLKPGIYQTGSPYKAVRDLYTQARKEVGELGRGIFPRIPHLKKPKSREMFNRSVMLHEGAELGKHPGRYKFLSHQSLKPPLQDLNIAATLTGTGGKEAATAIRRMRGPDIKFLYETVPELARLRLGKQRLSRHAIKRVQEIYDRAGSKEISSLWGSGSQFEMAARGPSTRADLAEPAAKRWLKKQKLAPIPKKLGLHKRLVGGLKRSMGLSAESTAKGAARAQALQQRQRLLEDWLRSKWGLSRTDAAEVAGAWSKHLG